MSADEINKRKCNMDIDDSELFETDDLNDTFSAAADHIQHTHSIYQLNDLLELYGLYKQATTGACNTSKPNIFQMKASAKWTAWHELGNLPIMDAKRLYIEKVKKLDPKWEKGDRTKKSSNWVVYSVPLPITDETPKTEGEQNSFDFVKEGNLKALENVLTNQDLSVLDDNGMGLIHWATDRNHNDVLRFLLNAGADANFRDKDQQTALHYASSCGHENCIRTLLSFKADCMAVDVDGNSCIDVSENNEIRQIFEEYNK